MGLATGAAVEFGFLPGVLTLGAASGHSALGTAGLLLTGVPRA